MEPNPTRLTAKGASLVTAVKTQFWEEQKILNDGTEISCMM